MNEIEQCIMELHQYDIYVPCDFEDPITELNGQATGRCKLPNTSNPAYVPIYTPKNTCPDPVNNDPRRNEVYCKPNPSLSQPLSSDEYLRKRLLNGNRPLSNSYLLQTNADTGIYRKTNWTEAGTSIQPSTAKGIDLGLPLPLSAPPVTGTNGTAIDSGLLTTARMAVAARGTLSALDGNGKRFDSFATLRRMGQAIISNPSGFGGFNQPCIECDLSGTSPSVVVGQFKCTCEGPKYNQYPGPFGLVWSQSVYGGSYVSPAISPDGRLIYIAGADKVYALETLSGQIIWHFANPFTGDNFPYSNMTAGVDGTLYFGGTNSNYFFALNGLTGKMKWYFQTSDSTNRFRGKPTFNLDNTIIYTASTGPIATVFAFNLSGTLLYSYTNNDLTNNTTIQSPTVGPNGRVYISYNQNLVALTPNLNFIWRIECGAIGVIEGLYNTTWYMPRVGPDGSLYVGSDDISSSLYCFTDNGSSATLKWTYTASSGESLVFSPVFGTDGQVYFTSNTQINSDPDPPSSVNQSSLLSISSVDGSVLWTYNYLGSNQNNYNNFLYAAVGSNGKIYLTNVVDSSLFVLKDLGYNFQFDKEIYNAEGTSLIGTFGSYGMSPPIFGAGGKVYWCNANYETPCIFGAGYPIVTEVFE